MPTTLPYLDFSTIKHLLTDSRNLRDPEQTLFFCLDGKGRSGSDFIPELYTKGVRQFVVPNSYKEIYKDAQFISCLQPIELLQEIAAYHKAKYAGQTIAITGSNGKTVVKEWLFQLISKQCYTYRSPKSYNSQIGVPLSVWELPLKSEVALIEAGISMPGEMENLAAIIRPNIGILTNIGQAHQENFTSLTQKAEEKLKLFEHCNSVIYRNDDVLTAELIRIHLPQVEHITWNMDSSPADYYINYQKEEQSISISQNGEQLASYPFPFSDDASIENIGHCLVCAWHLNMPPSTDDILRLEAIAMRLEQIKGLHGCHLINDAYNSDILSLGIALDALNKLALSKNLSKTVFLSDIEQSGLPALELYTEIASLLKTKGIDQLIAIGPQMCAHQHLFSVNEQVFYTDTSLFLSNESPNVYTQKAILFKGARAFQFEQIIRFFEEKKHQTVMEIDLNALRENYNYFRDLLNPSTKIMGMVKAFGYGSGYVEIARTLQQQGCDYLAVAVADEGIDLRNNGIRLPIIVMTPERNSFEAMLTYQLEPAIYSFSELEAFRQVATKANTKYYPIHLKLDTGMHRLGFSPSDHQELLAIFQSQSALKVTSVYSHLAAADEAQWDDFTHKQIEYFETFAHQLETGFGFKIIKHILNSAGTERFTSHQNDMVRLGIGMHGVSCIQHKMNNVATLKTRITQIRQVDATETVGYGRHGKLKKNSRIATLPIGYADGLRRQLGNGQGHVLIHGHKAPYIGNICMDLCMVDITEIDALEGDDVIVMGDEISPEMLAKLLKTIPYEVLTSISQRVKRVYVE